MNSTGFKYQNIDICNNFSSIIIGTSQLYNGSTFSSGFNVYYNSSYYDLAQLYYINSSLISIPSTITKLYLTYNSSQYDLASFFVKQSEASYNVGSGLTLASINTSGRSLYYGTSSNGTTMNNALSTTIVINSATRVKILMIGGGGNGGNGPNNNGGGQGGNGVYADISLNPGTYNITMDTGTASNTTYGPGGSNVTFALSGSSLYTITATGGSGGQINHTPGYNANPSNGLTSPTTSLSQSNVNSYYFARGSNGQSSGTFRQNGFVIVPETATISGITKNTNVWYYRSGRALGQTTSSVNYVNYFGITHPLQQDNYYYLPIDVNMFNDISSNTKTYKTFYQIGFSSGGEYTGYPGYSDSSGFVRGGRANTTGGFLSNPLTNNAYQAAGTGLYSIGCGGAGTGSATSGLPATGWLGGPAAIYLYF